jgi:hypothetical protein
MANQKNPQEARFTRAAPLSGSIRTGTGYEMVLRLVCLMSIPCSIC